MATFLAVTFYLMELAPYVKRMGKYGYLSVRAVPGSAQTEVVEVLTDESVKIRLKARAEQGQANTELMRYIAETMNVPRKNITLLSGASARLKLVRIEFPSQ